MKLPPEFFLRPDVVQIARDLLGHVLVTEFDGLRTAGRIVETEAYRAPDDRACHAFQNRRTARTEVMFRPGGCAYVYLCYGIHHLFNVVTGPEGLACAVLIRGIEPIEGQEIMLRRRNMARLKPSLSNGPGALARALGLHTRSSGQRFDLPGSPIWLEDRGEPFLEAEIAAGPRIGVDYAGECAALPWRFWAKNSVFARQR